MNVMCFLGALCMWAKSSSSKDGHHSIAMLPVLTETPALCCHWGGHDPGYLAQITSYCHLFPVFAEQ